MSSCLRILVAVSAICVLVAVCGLAHAAAPRDAVTLRGVILSPHHLTRIEAVERNRADVLRVSQGQPGDWIFSGHVSRATGRFTISGLPAGHTYDLVLWTRHERWEGVNMNYYRLAPPAGPMTRDDLKQVVTFIEKIPRFTNYNRPLWIAGNHHYATVVVEQIRNTPFHSGRAGAIIFRVATWYFERYYNGWAKVSNLGKVLTRWRGQTDKIPNPWQYLPALGGVHITDRGTYAELKIKLPKPSPQHGLDGSIPTGH